MDGKNVDALRLARQRDLNLAIETARTHERRVEDIGAVGRHDDLHAVELVKAIHLVQQLHQGALNLAVR